MKANKWVLEHTKNGERRTSDTRGKNTLYCLGMYKYRGTGSYKAKSLNERINTKCMFAVDNRMKESIEF